MRNFYTHNKTRKSDNQTRWKERLSGEISDSMNLLRVSNKSKHKDKKMNLANIAYNQDINIEEIFDVIQKKAKSKQYNFSSKDIDALVGYEFSLTKVKSNLEPQKARKTILEALNKNGKKGALKMYYYILGLRQKYEALVQMKYFLRDLKDGSTENMEEYLEHETGSFLIDLEEYWEIMKVVFQDKFKLPSVLLVGKTGTGKSCLCNILSGFPPDQDDGNDGFATSLETEACTETTTVKECCYFGDPRRPVKIIDTPGFDDPKKNHDAVIIADLVKKLKEDVTEINLIIFTLNGQNPRLEGSLKAMITIIQQMFTYSVWNNLAVVFTRLPMNKIEVQRRNKKRPNHDNYIGDKFVKKIEEEFKPLDGSKMLEYVFIDTHFNGDFEEESISLQENKEKLWSILQRNTFFKTDMVRKVLTEYESLQKELREKESMIAEKDRVILQFEKKEFVRIANENQERQKPTEGFTFLQFRDKHVEENMKKILNYRSFIEKNCPEKSRPFESGLTFSETIARIEQKKTTIFLPCETQHLRSESLVQRIPQRNRENKVAEIILIVEINNYTKHLLTGGDLFIEHGNSESLFVWDSQQDENYLPIPSLLMDFSTFVIPPYAKERLIFRNSIRGLNYSRLSGIMTMRMGDDVSGKMMLRFRIDGGNFKSSYNSYSVGFPNINMEVPQMIKEVKNQNDSLCRTLNFSRRDKKKELSHGKMLTFPDTEIPGKFNLKCWFENGRRSRCNLILSQTPNQEGKEETTKV